MLRKPGASIIRHRIAHHNGDVRLVELRAEPVFSVADRVTGLVGTLQDIPEHKRLEKRWVKWRTQLHHLSAHMESIRESERKRIALELHDELGQLLTAVKMNVSLLRVHVRSRGLGELSDTRELVERAIWEVRNVANQLSPAALQFGIVPALEWLASDFSTRNRIPCHLRMRGPESVLADEQATAVFRIVQASLTNVSRHAKASLVDITLVIEF
jgi:signal transduction histidine kinase